MNVATVVTLLSFCATLALPGKCNYTLYALGTSDDWGRNRAEFPFFLDGKC